MKTNKLHIISMPLLGNRHPPIKHRFISFLPFSYLFLLFLLNMAIDCKAQDLNNLKKREKFKMTGNIATGSSVYAANGINNRRTPWAYYVSASTTISIYEFNLPFSFAYRDQKGSFSQPFHRFNINPTYKWVKVGVGNTSLDLSEYTMSGQYYRGISLELTPKKFTFKAGYGDLENPLAQIDTLVAGTFIIPTYKRKMMAMLLGFGNSKKYIDIIYFRAKDDIKNTDPTLINRKLINPQANTVLGLKFGLPINKYLSWNANYAGSIFSSNTEAISEFQSTEEKAIVTKFKDLFNYNISTKLQFAGDVSLNYKRKRFGTGIEYKRVDPLYKSLGTYYFLEDYQNLTLKLNLNLAKNKIRFNGSGGLQRNNLNKLRSITSTRKIINTTLSIAPNQKFNITLRASNFQSDRVPVLTSINDSIKFTQTTESYSIMPVYSLKGKNRMSVISMMINYQKMIDLGMNLEGDGGILNYVGNINYSTTIKDPELGLSTSLLINKNIIGITENKRIGGNVSVSKKIYKKKISASTGLGFIANNINGQSDGATITGNIGLNYRVKRKISINLNTNFLFRQSKIQSFQEYRGQFKISYQFASKSKKNNESK